MKVVWKYELLPLSITTLELPKDSKSLYWNLQYEKPYLWALIDPEEKEKETRYFLMCGTGAWIEEEIIEHIGTIEELKSDVSWIRHLFEIKADNEKTKRLLEWTKKHVKR